MQTIYYVNFTYTETGYLAVSAKTRKEAEDLVHDLLLEEGFDTFSRKYQCCYRDFHILGSCEPS